MSHHSFRVTGDVGIRVGAVHLHGVRAGVREPTRAPDDAGLVDAGLLSPESVYMTGI